MQTAVECNGSNTTTTTTTTTAPNSNIIDNSLQPQQLQQPESILFNRLLAGKIHNNNTNTNSTSSSISSSSNNSLNNQTNQESQESSVRAIAAQYEEFILGSPSKGAAKSKPLSKTTTIPQVTKVIPVSNTIPSTTTTVIATTPTSNSSYNSCNSSEASTPTGTGTTTSATALIPSRSAYMNVSGAGGVSGDSASDGNSNYDELLQWKDMPKYLQFNPYVLKGYRPLQTFKGCLLSLFYWHNETINILTHAIPIVYILAIVPGLMPWEKGYRFLSFCHVFGSVAPWCGSFVYHLFMNIEKGENVYYRLLKVDMVGIWVSQSFGALPLVTATTFCFTPKWKWFIIISYCLFSLWGLYKAMTASSPWQRRLCFALPFTMRSILTFLRTMGVVGGNRIALSHVYLQDGVSILGGAIGAMRIPEKWFPGLVDFYLNSHNIMHVLVVVAVYSMHQATVKDMEWMSATQCSSFNITNQTIYSIINSNIEL